MDAYKDKAFQLIDELDIRLVKYDTVESLHKKTGVRRAYLVLGVALLVVSFILFGFGSGPLCNLVGFAYPLYASFKAINSDRKDDDSQWLTYWVVYAFFTVVESFTDILLAWIPFYHFFKMAFLLWCYLPQFEGALWIYKRFLDPYIEKEVEAIELQAKSLKKSLGLKDKASPIERPPAIADANAHVNADANVNANANAATPAPSAPPAADALATTTAPAPGPAPSAPEATPAGV